MHCSMFMTLLASMFILFVLEDEVKCISRRRAASARRRATNPAPTARRRSTNPKPPGGSGGSSTDCDKSIGNAVACAALEQMTQSAVEKIWNTDSCHGSSCAWGTDNPYPCHGVSSFNYGCEGGKCWSQCKAIFGGKEWCWTKPKGGGNYQCSKHEDCKASADCNQAACSGACALV